MGTRCPDLTPAARAAVLALYAAGESYAAIAARTGVGRSAASMLVKRAGLTGGRKRGPAMMPDSRRGRQARGLPLRVPRAEREAKTLALYEARIAAVADRLHPACFLYTGRDDLLQEGRVGFLRACRRFRPGRGKTLSAYALPRVRGAMLDHLRATDPVKRKHRAELRAAGLAIRTHQASVVGFGRAFA